MPLFESITLYGTAGAIVWGYQDAATVGRWRIYHHRPDAKHDARWTLTATITRADKLRLRQRPLLFSAKRPQGFWCFPLHTASIQMSETRIQALLGPPEQ